MTDLYHQLFALSDPIRMTLCMLMHEHGGTLHVMQLEEHVNAQWNCNLRQPTISHHIAILRKAGLVTSERHGLHKYYSFNHAAYVVLLDALQVRLPVRAQTIAVA
jgi:ArsR family transcriptional regulator, arsenate/arsenite/antimonite-responsive transcriptional repressor